MLAWVYLLLDAPLCTAKGPMAVPSPSIPVFFSFLSQWIRGTLSPSLLIFTILTFLLSSQCLSHGEEIRLILLPFIPAHSYLSKDQPFPSWALSLPCGLSDWSTELLASLQTSPWERDLVGSAQGFHPSSSPP